MNDSKKINPIVKSFIDMYAKSIKPLIKKCPLSGRVKIDLQFESTKNFITMLPHGNYQFSKNVYNKEDKDVYSASFNVKIY
jgi:hypothetical protein